MTAHSSTQLRVVATQLGTTAQGLRSRSQHHRLVATQVGSSRRELAAAWRSPSATELGSRLNEVVSSVSAAPDPLDHAAMILGELADQAQSLAAQLSTAESSTASLERQLQQNSWAPDPDPVAAERLRGQLSATRQQSVRAQQQWEVACSRSQTRLLPVLDALRAALRGLPTIPRPSRTVTGAGRGSPGGIGLISRLRELLRASMERSAPLLRWIGRLPRSERRQPPSSLPLPPVLAWPPYLVGRGLGERLREGARDTVGTLGAAGATLLGAALRGRGSLSSVGGELGRIAAERLPLPNADLLRAGVEWAAGAWQMAGSALSSAWRATTGVVTGAWNWATNTVSSAWRWNVDTVRDAWQFGTSAVSSAWNWATGTARDVGRGVVDLARGARDLAVAGVQATGRLAVDAWQGLTSAASAAWDWTTDLVGSTVRAAAEAADRAGRLLFDAFRVALLVERLRPRIVLGRLVSGAGRPSPSTPPSVFDDASLGELFALFDTGSPRNPDEVAAAIRAIGAERLEALIGELASRSDPAAQQLLEVIGALDGAPAHLRHQANMVLLEREMARLLEEEDMVRFRLLNDLHISLRDPLQQRHDAGLPELRLLLFRPELNHIAVAAGDTDTADHVTTMVRGTGTTFDDIQKYIGDAETMMGIADGVATQPGELATVVWLGYDAPPDLLEATYARWGEAGAPALDDWMSGIRAANPDALSSVVAHSYGAFPMFLAAANTRNPAGFQADNVIGVSPAGTAVDSVDDLHLTDGAQVFVVADRTDRLFGDQLQLATGGPLGVATYELGVDPSSDGFGAQLLVGDDANSHSLNEYLQATTAGRNIARIIIGDYDRLNRR